MKHRLYRLLNNRLTLPHRPFYRRYPYRGGVSINSADARGCVDTELGFFCSRIPKAANSTVITNLARYKFGREIPSKRAKKLFRHPSQLSREEVARLDRLFRFTVVRNPYTRTLSAYLDKVERRRQRGQPAPESFAAFLDALADGDLYGNAHWAPQSALLLLPAEQFDFIGRVENLEQDMATIRARILGEEEPATPFTSMLGNATGAGRRLQHYYDQDCIARVRELFRDDFAALGYSTDFPA